MVPLANLTGQQMRVWRVCCPVRFVSLLAVPGSGPKQLLGWPMYQEKRDNYPNV